MTAYTVLTVQGIGEVEPGADLATVLLGGRLEGERGQRGGGGLRDGDLVVITSKVVSKAEGRVVAGDREALLPAETDRVVARRGPTTIVRTRHGLIMAAAGIDASNTPPGTAVLLPVDPDASARRVRARLLEAAAVNVGVILSDTSGRAWRQGQTDIAIGASGVVVLDDHAGRTDAYGNALVVTAPAVADEVAAAADLATGKVSGTPFAVVRGLASRVLPPGEDGPGAAALIRPQREDLFGLGAREAVVCAVSGESPQGFGATAEAREVAAALERALPVAEPRIAPDGTSLTVRIPTDARRRGRQEALLEVVVHAHGWVCAEAEPHSDAEPGSDAGADADAADRRRCRPSAP